MFTHGMTDEDSRRFIEIYFKVFNQQLQILPGAALLDIIKLYYYVFIARAGKPCKDFNVIREIIEQYQVESNVTLYADVLKNAMNYLNAHTYMMETYIKFWFMCRNYIRMFEMFKLESYTDEDLAVYLNAFEYLIKYKRILFTI